MNEKLNDLIKNIAVSEVVSTVIMIAIAIAVFIPINFYLLDDIDSSIEPSTSIVSKLEGNKIVIEHCGGPSLSLDTSCTVNIGGKPTILKAQDLLDSESKKNKLWDIGERLVYDLGDITYFQVSLSIADKNKNQLLCNGIIQDGLIGNFSYIIITYDPLDIMENSSKLCLGYNFRNKTGSVRFSYKSIGDNWINTSWVPKSGSGEYNVTITGLSPDLIYIYKAELICESNIIEGEIKPILQDGITSVSNITPSDILFSPLALSAIGSSNLDKINLYYRYSYDNVSWGKNWWQSSWRYRKLITIDPSKVADDCINFPVLIYKTIDSDLASNAQDDGDDIAFVSYNDNTTKLNHEIQYFDSSNGEIISWVNLPLLSSIEETKIWMYYGNSNANNQENVHGVWDSNYVAVWHLDESPDDGITGHLDSTSNNNHGIPKNFQDSGGGSTNAIGKIGGANYFSGDDDWVEIPHSSSFVINGNQLSLSAWVKMTALQDNDEGIIVKSDGSNYNMQLGIQGNEKGNFRVKTQTGTTYLTGITTLQVNQWYYLYGIYNGLTAKIYLNKFQDGSENRNGNVISPVVPVVIGRRALGDNRFFQGIIDEARITYNTRTPEWFETEYNNQNSPSSFFSMGSQEEYSGDWTKWSNVNNPDKNYPWAFNFDFPNGEGYYQFYSIGYYNDYQEIAPNSADTFCYYEEGTKVDPIIPFNQTVSPSTITATGENIFDNVVLYYRFSNDNTNWEIGSGEITWSSELLTNPSFETGDTTGWINGGGGTLTVGTDCPWGTKSPYDGTYYAYWRETDSNVNAYAYQNISLDSYGSYIDIGNAKINVTGWLVSDEYNVPVYDEFLMNIKFYDSTDDHMIGFDYQSGGTNPIFQGSGNNVNNWMLYGITNYTIPSGARKVQVRFYTWEYTGSIFYDAGSADKFSVKVGTISSSNNWIEYGSDSIHPWNWVFNFQNGSGYYGFYSIGYSGGTPIENPPFIADTICKKN